MAILDRLFVPLGRASAGMLIISKEITRIWKILEAKKINIRITQEDFKHYWTCANEQTSSSYSGFLFGYYFSAAFPPKLSCMHALYLSILIKTG